MLQIVVGIVLFLISASALTLSIFAFIRANKYKSDLDLWIGEVKERMKVLITDINTVNEQNYNFDVKNNSNTTTSG
jgi:hypothetical protein